VNHNPQASNQAEWDSSIPDTDELWPFVAPVWVPEALAMQLRPTMKWVRKGSIQR
jgi:hypothetical protein